MSKKIVMKLEVECEFEDDEGSTGEAVYRLTKHITKSGYWNLRKISAEDNADVTLKAEWKPLTYTPGIFTARNS